ncbi:hypothetical protein U0070_025587, partial [Myodes glareolus]
SLSVSLRTLSQCYTKINLIRLGMSTMFVVLMVVFLVEAWYSQRVSPSRPSCHIVVSIISLKDPRATMNPWSRWTSSSSGFCEACTDKSLRAIQAWDGSSVSSSFEWRRGQNLAQVHMGYFADLQLLHRNYNPISP